MVKLNLLIITFLLSLLLVPMTATVAYAQGGDETYVDSSEEDNDKKGKKKKDPTKEDDFATLGLDKLSDKFFWRLLINFVATFILIRLIYFPNYRKGELFMTFFIFNFVIFLITYLLNKVDMGLGAAFGLFAVFSMLRYRTENISTKDMTYLFLVIAIGLVTAVAKATAFELCLLNGMILLFTFALEGNLLMKKEFSKSVLYENIDLVRTENHALLIEDLKRRTGLNIHRIAITKVDFLKDSAAIKVYYYEGTRSKTTNEGTPETVAGGDDD
jgi:cation transport ATPase